jgi:4-hydroxysphinganine ceramide fatty acyl 2-hydroxylase
MLLVFCRHGGVAALLAAVAAETPLWLVGVVALQPALILVGALRSYLSEYGMHRFAFHAPPLSWPPARKLQRRLHYDHHVEPNRLDLLFLPLWFLYVACTRAREHLLLTGVTPASEYLERFPLDMGHFA